MNQNSVYGRKLSGLRFSELNMVQFPQMLKANHLKSEALKEFLFTSFSVILEI